MRLHIVRHGQSTHNANDDVPHNPDPPPGGSASPDDLTAVRLRYHNRADHLPREMVT